MPSSRSSKHHTPSYVSSPAWSMNTLTGTSASGASGSGGVPLPVTPVLNPVGLPSPPGSASRPTQSGYIYASQFPTTPGAPHMNTVPLPGSQHTLPTPPVSPERSRYAAVLSELLVYTGHRPAKLNYNAVQPPSAACLHPSCNPHMLNEPAISTRAPCLVLEIPGVSGGAFYAASSAGGPHAVSVREVLYALHAKLSERAGQTDFNQLPSDSHRRAASASFNRRNAVAPDPAGLRRSDLLGGRTTFAGLQRAANGADVWLVHFI
ncbi:hypothetical protein EDB86DRAFT_3082215 [Lactarius hatsudake]|nr:hypothetical protein EDB86DRAFT_3082215 [Lactarius hatsudake]